MSDKDTILIKEKENHLRKKEAYSTLTITIRPHDPNVQMSEEVKKGASLKLSMPLVEEVKGPFDEKGNLVSKMEVGKTYIFKATKFKKSMFSPIKNIWWAEQIDDGEIKDLEYKKDVNPYSDEQGNVCYKYTAKECKKVRIYAYMAKPIKEVSVECNVNGSDTAKIAFRFFIVFEEMIPSEKLTRKVSAYIPSKPKGKVSILVEGIENLKDALRGNQFEEYGMQAKNLNPNLSIGEHVRGFKGSKYTSASTLPKGAPTIIGEIQYIDIKKASAAGCKIYSTKEIIRDLRRLQEAATPQVKEIIEKLIYTVENVEKEVLIEGDIPKEAIKSAKTMRWVKALRVLGVVSFCITVYDLEQATEKSIEKESSKPIIAETIRQVGGWGGAIAGVKSGAFIGAMAGIESGPGLIVTGLIGAIVGGYLGYKGADIIADQIDEN